MLALTSNSMSLNTGNLFKIWLPDTCRDSHDHSLVATASWIQFSWLQFSMAQGNQCKLTASFLQNIQPLPPVSWRDKWPVKPISHQPDAAPTSQDHASPAALTPFPLTPSTRWRDGGQWPSYKIHSHLGDFTTSVWETIDEQEWTEWRRN